MSRHVPSRLWKPASPALTRPRGMLLPIGLPVLPSAAVIPPQRATAGSSSSSTDTASYNFGTLSIGAETLNDLPRSLVVVAITATDNNNERAFSSCTIGGVAGTVLRSDKSTTSPDSYSVLVSRVLTGTTANVTVNWSSTMGECAALVYALYGLQDTTPFHTNGNNVNAASALSVTLNIPHRGLAIACNKTYINNAAHTATGLDEDLDLGVEGRHHYMSSQDMEGETGRTITSTGTASAARSISAASWF